MVAYKWNGKEYISEPYEEEPKFKTNKEYKEWLSKNPTDGTKEKPSGA